MCSEMQFNKIIKEMVDCYKVVTFCFMAFYVKKCQKFCQTLQNWLFTLAYTHNYI